MLSEEQEEKLRKRAHEENVNVLRWFAWEYVEEQHQRLKKKRWPPPIPPLTPEEEWDEDLLADEEMCDEVRKLYQRAQRDREKLRKRLLLARPRALLAENRAGKNAVDEAEDRVIADEKDVLLNKAGVPIYIALLMAASVPLAYDALRKREKRDGEVVSLDKPVTLPSGEEVSRHEAIADPTISFEASEIRILLEQFRETLPDVERDVFDLLLAGERGKDIADELGRTQGRISQIRKKLRQRWEIQFPD